MGLAKNLKIYLMISKEYFLQWFIAATTKMGKKFKKFYIKKSITEMEFLNILDKLLKAREKDKEFYIIKMKFL